MTYKINKNKHSSNLKIINIIRSKNNIKNILDVGIGDGYIGKLFHSNKIKIIGIDICTPSNKNIYNYYDKLIIQDIEQLSFNNLNKFDIIIAADILEHCKNPSFIVDKLSLLLNDTGLLIISLPNIANIYTRLNLLFGNFNYTENGIIDKTHLRFFTLKTAKDLLTTHNLKIHNIHYTPIPFSLIFKNHNFSNILYFIYHFLLLLNPRLFAYQFVITSSNN